MTVWEWVQKWLSEWLKWRWTRLIPRRWPVDRRCLHQLLSRKSDFEHIAAHLEPILLLTGDKTLLSHMLALSNSYHSGLLRRFIAFIDLSFCFNCVLLRDWQKKGQLYEGADKLLVTIIVTFHNCLGAVFPEMVSVTALLINSSQLTIFFSCILK